MLSTKTPSEVHKILASTDVCVTNQKDKETMLPKISVIDARVRQLAPIPLPAQIEAVRIDGNSGRRYSSDV